MKIPTSQTQKPALSRGAGIVLALAFLGLACLVLAALLLLWFGLFPLPGTAQIPTPLPPGSATPEMVIPVTACEPASLALGAATFPVQPLDPAPDGSLSVPSATSGVAYWVRGSGANPLFVFSPSQENLSQLTTLAAGSAATATWSNCVPTTHTLSAPEWSSLSTVTASGGSTTGLTIFFQTDASGNGFAVRAEAGGEQASAVDLPTQVVENTLPPAAEGAPPALAANTSAPAAEILMTPGELIPPPSGDVLAEITLLDTSASPDGTGIRVGVSIYNYGSSAFTLSASDVALTPEGAAPLALIKSEPALPRAIGAGGTETITFTFPRPPSPTATFRIFTVEYDIEGY